MCDGGEWKGCVRGLDPDGFVHGSAAGAGVVTLGDVATHRPGGGGVGIVDSEARHGDRASGVEAICELGGSLAFVSLMKFCEGTWWLRTQLFVGDASCAILEPNNTAAAASGNLRGVIISNN